jgi:hypothetical protein
MGMESLNVGPGRTLDIGHPLRGVSCPVQMSDQSDSLDTTGHVRNVRNVQNVHRQSGGERRPDGSSGYVIRFRRGAERAKYGRRRTRPSATYCQPRRITGAVAEVDVTDADGFEGAQSSLAARSRQMDG